MAAGFCNMEVNVVIEKCGLRGQIYNMLPCLKGTLWKKGAEAGREREEVAGK